MNAPLRNITLEDKYALSQGRIFLTGTQALVRLLLLQHQRDALAGLNTAGYVSGYRGSPLGGLDQALWKAKTHLAQNQIVFQPGVNEDLAATALWGTQQVNLSSGAKHDGVFGMWYGKGPGVDRCGDVFKHANSAGTWKYGGILAIAGDDHAARSSTVAHQSEHAFKAAMMPVLVPAGVQDYLDLGLHGWAMSRYSGCWVGFKAVADTVESSASVDVSPDRVKIVLPTDYALPTSGLNIRWPDDRLLQEARLLDHKLYAALAYCRANRLNQVVIDAPNPRLGIITTGKSYLDVRQAFDDLGIDDQLAAEIGIRLYKIGMVWPLESDGVRRFAEGLEEILVVEEKRQLIEYQLKEELYNWREDVRPRVIGKFDEQGEWALPNGRWLLPASGELSPAQIARVIADRIGRHFTSTRIRERLAVIEAKERAAAPTNPDCTHALLLPGLPAQHLDLRAGRLTRAGRHRLPFHGVVDEPQHGDLFPYGRRRRGLDGPGAFHRTTPRLRQPWRRHLLPLRFAGDSRRSGLGRQCHLQDSLQRRRGDDWRPAGGRQPDGAANCPPTACGGCPSRRRRHRRHRPCLRPPGSAAWRADPPS